MATPEQAVRIGTAVSLLTLAIGYLLLGPVLLAIWLPLSLVTGIFVMWWDSRVAHNYGGPMSLLVIVLLALNWPSTLTIWFVRTSR
jgi:hypothetical protein